MSTTVLKSQRTTASTTPQRNVRSVSGLPAFKTTTSFDSHRKTNNAIKNLNHPQSLTTDANQKINQSFVGHHYHWQTEALSGGGDCRIRSEFPKHPIF